MNLKNLIILSTIIFIINHKASSFSSLDFNFDKNVKASFDKRINDQLSSIFIRSSIFLIFYLTQFVNIIQFVLVISLKDFSHCQTSYIAMRLNGAFHILNKL